MMAGAMKRSRTSGPRLRTPALSPSELSPCELRVREQIHQRGVRSRQWDSNPRPGVYKTPARPIELCRPVGPEEGSEAGVRRLALASSGPSPEEASRLSSLERHPRRVRPARYRTRLPTATHEPDLSLVVMIG